MKIFIFIATVSIFTNASASSKTVECAFSALKVDDSIVNIPSTGALIYHLQEVAATANYYPTFSGSQDTELLLDEGKKLKLKTTVFYIQDRSSWFFDFKGKDRIQIVLTILDQNDKVIAAYTEHSDRILTDYSLEEVHTLTPYLRLALFIPSTWATVFAHPETSETARNTGMREAVNQAYRLKFLKGSEVHMLGVTCKAL